MKCVVADATCRPSVLAVLMRSNEPSCTEYVRINLIKTFYSFGENKYVKVPLYTLVDCKIYC